MYITSQVLMTGFSAATPSPSPLSISEPGLRSKSVGNHSLRSRFSKIVQNLTLKGRISRLRLAQNVSKNNVVEV
jgi:hypothetical protein